ncbi:MAG: tRNA (N6-isopentenyl adenosine(37)-C2)-methylthiotransferase MiaB [Pelagibacteraceae bacterium TMED268]|nr:MAG: tRNA (N6-isopentenyl adenosine(37)-C2)-methylthiotransferase MiaB [Pelagibacteraceae bacterium TMED268]|tara:strand:- start:3203 stop:4537 length:1335 start_codon:yes stop_codon:yes gene_type:complete
MEKKIFIKTFGCQMNVYDSNRIFDSVKKIGFIKTDKHDDANCYILNTCHIRDKAKEKVYHEVGRVKKLYKKKNKPIMIVAGCVAQAENQEMLKREPFIDIVIGPQSYHKINQLIKNFTEKKKKEETDFDTIKKFEYFDKIKNSSSKISSFLTIQEGCDKFCHFCVVPFTRGPEYSRPFRKVMSEAEELIKNGVKEITLVGQNVNAYSYEENSKVYKISDLLNELEKYSELDRIRYTTSHPRDMTDDLIDCYSTNKKLMPFIHLPIQSGSNKILKLMNRKHTVEEYLNIYEKLKKIDSKIEFSSDFIISYPGETDKDFEDTINLIKKIKFINSYSFIFSPRPGTKAADLKLIDNEISKDRLIKVQKILFSHQLEMNKSFKNKSIDILVENKMKEQNKLFGRNKYLNSVIFEGDEKNIGKIIKVKIANCNQNSLFGEVVNNNMRAA